MGVTPLLSLPFPEATDVADVPKDIHALALALDTNPTGVVTSLPGSPVDGQVIDLLVDAANGVVWRFRYRAAATGAYKWEFVGGPPRSANWYGNVGQVLSATAYQAYTVPGSPTSLTIPLAGDYQISSQSNLAVATSGGTSDLKAGPGSGVVAANTPTTMLNSGAEGATGIINGYVNLCCSYRLTGRAAGDAFQMRAASITPSLNVFVADQSLQIVPIRVG